MAQPANTDAATFQGVSPQMIAALSQLLPTLFGSRTNTTENVASTISPQAAGFTDAVMAQLLPQISGTQQSDAVVGNIITRAQQGLPAILSTMNQGGYNSTISQLMINDLLARAAGESAAAVLQSQQQAASTAANLAGQTQANSRQQTRQVQQRTPGQGMNLGTALGALNLIQRGRRLLEQDAVRRGAGSAVRAGSGVAGALPANAFSELGIQIGGPGSAFGPQLGAPTSFGFTSDTLGAIGSFSDMSGLSNLAMLSPAGAMGGEFTAGLSDEMLASTMGPEFFTGAGAAGIAGGIDAGGIVGSGAGSFGFDGIAGDLGASVINDALTSSAADGFLGAGLDGIAGDFAGNLFADAATSAATDAAAGTFIGGFDPVSMAISMGNRVLAEADIPVISDVAGAFTSVTDAIFEPITSAVGTVICTHMHRMGELSDEDYQLTFRAGQRLSETTRTGYRFWAVPLVHHMQKNPDSFTSRVTRRFVRGRVAMHRGKFSAWGLFTKLVGEPGCWLIGRWLELTGRAAGVPKYV